jgi:hypothetical protein
MTQEIEKSDWKSFFEKLSKEKFGWETNVQVLSDATGANMLSEGLPFNGITYEENEEGASIEIIIGKTTEKHDSHTIADPKMVAFQPDDGGTGGTLDIEDASGAKTLVSFLSEPGKKSRDATTGHRQ